MRTYVLQAHQRDLLLAELFKVGSRGSAAAQRVGIMTIRHDCIHTQEEDSEETDSDNNPRCYRGLKYIQ